MNFLNIVWIILISFGINYLFFIIAFSIKTDAFTDITYSLSFSLIAIVFFSWKQNFSFYQIIIFILINLWAIRLGSYLLQRIIKIKVDHRFDRMRNSFWKFGGFWTLQGASIVIIGLPGFFSLTINRTYFTSPNYWVLSLIILAVIFLLIESWADYTKFYFYNHRQSPNTFISTSIWKYSRHPNYFGEISFWFMITGIFLFGFYLHNNFLIPNNGFHLLWLLSPIFLMLLINFVSGVNLLEAKSFQRLKNNLKYQQYVLTTPCVIPFIGRKRASKMKQYLRAKK